MKPYRDIGSRAQKIELRQWDTAVPGAGKERLPLGTGTEGSRIGSSMTQHTWCRAGQTQFNETLIGVSVARLGRQRPKANYKQVG
jgi:hypothetical protein